MTSDNVAEYDDEKKATLQEAQKLSDARITDIERQKNMITITYQLDGQEKKLQYNSAAGVILS